jgi:hypothetical protein
MHPAAVEGSVLLGRFLHIGIGYAPAARQQIDMRQHGGRPLRHHAGHGRQADGHFAQQHDVPGLKIIHGFGLVQDAQPAHGLALVQRQIGLGTQQLGLGDCCNTGLLGHGFLLSGVGLEAHRGEEAGFQRSRRGLQQLGRELVALPELVAVVLERGLPAQRAENEAAARLAVIAVERRLAALQQAFGAQKIFVKRIARRVDEMQRRALALAVDHKQHMGHGAGWVEDAGHAIEIGAAGQRRKAGRSVAVAAGVDRAPAPES